MLLKNIGDIASAIIKRKHVPEKAAPANLFRAIFSLLTGFGTDSNICHRADGIKHSCTAFRYLS
jgi:hypothetical protein